MMNFWRLCALNPDPRCREDLYKFLINNDLTLTPSGYFVAYRNVNVKNEGLRERNEFVAEQSKCTAGTLDAEAYHGRKGGAIALGALFGPFALVGTALVANPTPDKGARTYMMSKNKELFNDPEYLSCYKKKAKGQLVGQTGLGWAAWALLVLL
jgi:hypothetical protein